MAVSNFSSVLFSPLLSSIRHHLLLPVLSLFYSPSSLPLLCPSLPSSLHMESEELEEEDRAHVCGLCPEAMSHPENWVPSQSLLQPRKSVGQAWRTAWWLPPMDGRLLPLPILLTTHGLSDSYLLGAHSVGGSRTLSQLTWVQGREWEGQSRKPGTGWGTNMVLGGSGFGAGQDFKWVRCPQAWQKCRDRERCFRRRQKVR